MPEIPHAAEVQITEEAQTEALKTLKEDLDIANTRIRDLEQERDDLTSQLVSSKQKQLNLINEVGGIKEARPEAEDYQALKTAKDALEKKFVEVRYRFEWSFPIFKTYQTQLPGLHQIPENKPEFGMEFPYRPSGTRLVQIFET